MTFRVFIYILVFSVFAFNIILMINAFLKLRYSARTFDIILTHKVKITHKVNTDLIKGIDDINLKKENIAVAFRLAQYEIENFEQHGFLF